MFHPKRDLPGLACVRLSRRKALGAGLALLLTTGAAGPLLAEAKRFQADWPNTDFERRTIDLAEVTLGGPPKDGIPAIMSPRFRKASQETRLEDREPVMVLVIGKAAARAYPVRYLMWHEIVNDVIAGQPVAVTYCPLCNTGMIFDARINGKAMTFGVSGLLRHSDMIMYDKETDSWWQQALGTGVVGQHAGANLNQLPGWMESWELFRKNHPEGLVMEEPDWSRAYGSNPYVGYDTSRPFLYSGENPPHGIHPLERVVRVGNRAWPMTRLSARGQISEAGVVLTWTEGQASALDNRRIGAGRDVGNVRVRDGSGKDVVHDIPFAFAFHAFHPEGIWMIGQ